MNNQEAFSRIWQHFIVDKQPMSSNPVTGACYYRHPTTGAKCAVGILIPDDQCPPRVDEMGYSIEKLVRHVPALNGLDRMLLCELQGAHDNASRYGGVEQIRRLEFVLRFIAHAHDLTVPEGAIA